MVTGGWLGMRPQRGCCTYTTHTVITTQVHHTLLPLGNRDGGGLGPFHMPRECGCEVTERSECTDQLQHNLVSNNDDLCRGWSLSGHQVIGYERSDLYTAVHGGYYGYQTPPPHPANHRRPTETRNCKISEVKIHLHWKM